MRNRSIQTMRKHHNHKIDLPFQPESKELMLSGKKTATTRTKRYGSPGDWFEAFGRIFVLTEVYRANLYAIALNRFQEEGFDYPQAFIEYWNRIHPRITYMERPTRLVYFYRFIPKHEATAIMAVKE